MFKRLKEHYVNGMRKMNNYTDAEAALVVAKHVFIVAAIIQAPLTCAAIFASTQALKAYRENRREDVD